MTHFTRGAYGSVSFVQTGCTVTAFESTNEWKDGPKDWCLRIGSSVYSGFATRREAVENVGRFI